MQSLLQHDTTQRPSAANALHHEFHTISPDSYFGSPTQPNQNVGTSIQSLDALTQIFLPLLQDINDMQEVDNAIWEPAFWDWNQYIYGLPETSKPSENACENQYRAGPLPQDIVARDANMFREETAFWSVNQGSYNIPDKNLGGGRDAPMPIFGEEHNS